MARTAKIQPNTDSKLQAATPATPVADDPRWYLKGYEIVEGARGRKFVRMGEGMVVDLQTLPVGGDEEAMFIKLSRDPLVSSFYPAAIGEKAGLVAEHVQMNGLRMRITKGKMLKIPQGVAEVIADSLNRTASAPADVETVNPATGEMVNPNLAYRSQEELHALTR